MEGEISNALVCLLGIGTVFFGLICIVILCKIMSKVIGSISSGAKQAAQTPAAPSAVPAASASTGIQNRQEVIAAVSAAIAETLGTDISAIRILSFKKL